MGRGRPLKKKTEKILAHPQPAAGAPVRPSGLGKIAREKWGKLLPMLAPTGMLTQADADLLEQYCVAYETWRTARTKLKTKSAVMTGRNGGDYPSPWVAIRNQAAAEMRILWKKLGMDPASRMELQVDVGPKLADDPKARFFKARESA